MKKSNIIRIFVGTGLLLLIPLISMQFSDDVDWNLFDFIVMGALLIGTGLVYELVTSRLNGKNRAIAAIVILIAFLLIWAELAVGLFDSPFAGS